MSSPPVQPWQEQVFGALKRGHIEQIAFVPDAGHAFTLRAAREDEEIRDIVLTTEEEGVGVVAGAWLGGRRAALLMQSSGVGNCVNAFSLLENCGFPFLALVTMRGEYAEFNPWQSPMGRRTREVLELMSIHTHRVDHPEEAGEVVSAAIDAAFVAGGRTAVLFSQRLIGRKQWDRN